MNTYGPDSETAAGVRSGGGGREREWGLRVQGFPKAIEGEV